MADLAVSVRFWHKFLNKNNFVEETYFLKKASESKANASIFQPVERGGL